MKYRLIKYILFAFFLLNSISGFSQNYIDIITEKSCACLDNISENIKTDELHLKLGICMLEAAEPYKKQLQAEYGIDLNKSDDSGEKLGRMVGLKMATKCPNALLKIAGKSNEDENTEKSAKGVVTKIDTEGFVSFSIKDENGKTAKFYWLTFIESGAELPAKYKSYLGKSVYITYNNQEFFDPKIEEYRPFSIILKMELE